MCFMKVGGAYKAKAPTPSISFMEATTFHEEWTKASGSQKGVYRFLICPSVPSMAIMNPAGRNHGFLFPAFTERCANLNGIDIFQADATIPIWN